RRPRPLRFAGRLRRGSTPTRHLWCSTAAGRRRAVADRRRAPDPPAAPGPLHARPPHEVPRRAGDRHRRVRSADGRRGLLAADGLILGGTLDRFPGLSVVLVHGGGFLPYHIGRFDRAHETRPEARVDDAGLPSRYLRRFFYDTLVQRPEALRYLVQLVGHDRVMLGSDHPFWMGDPDPLRVVREAGLDPATEAA